MPSLTIDTGGAENRAKTRLFLWLAVFIVCVTYHHCVERGFRDSIGIGVGAASILASARPSPRWTTAGTVMQGK